MAKYEIELELPKFKVVDFHVHFPIVEDDWLKPYRDRFIKENGEAKWHELQEMKKLETPWLDSYCWPNPNPNFVNCEDAENYYIQQIKHFGLEKLNLVTAGNNEIAAGIIKRHPDYFMAFAHHDIQLENAAELLEEAIANGLTGYKILGPVVKKPLSDACFDPVWEVCQKHELLRVSAFGILGGAGGVISGANMSPIVLADVAKRYTKVKFVVPHFGCGFTNDLLMLAWACPNVYVDTSGNNLWTKWTMENYTLEQLFRKFYETVGVDRIIYGTDSEWAPRGYAIRYFLDQYRACKNIGMNEEELEKVFRLNALKVVEHR